MIVTGIDTETTGFKARKGDKILEVCFHMWRVETDGTFTHLRTITQRINPLRAIPEEAQAVHGITLESLKDCPTWQQYAPTVKKILDATDLFVIHNAAFDLEFLEAEQEAAGLPIGRALPTICTMENGRWACADGKAPRLAELCDALGIEFDPEAAHGAEYDTGKMMEAYWKAIELGLFPQPK